MNSPGITTPRSRNGTGDTQIAAADIAPVAAPVPLDFESTTDALTADMSPPPNPYRLDPSACSWVLISRRAIVILCTSSGPSAMRNVRTCAYIDASGVN